MMFLPTSGRFPHTVRPPTSVHGGQGVDGLLCFLTKQKQLLLAMPSHHLAKLAAEEKELTGQELEPRGCREGMRAGIVMDILCFCLVREKLRFQ